MQQHYPHSILSTFTNNSSSSSFLCSPFFINNNICRRRRISSSSSSIHGFQFNFFNGKRRNLRLKFNRNRAVERDSEFEVDPDKAREALRKLDQQLQSLSDKKISPPKIRASEVNLTRDQRTREEEPEFTGAFLPYAALLLFIFTIFYNVIFFKVIVPSIDGTQPELSPPSVPMFIREEASQPQKSPPLLE